MPTDPVERGLQIRIVRSGSGSDRRRRKARVERRTGLNPRSGSRRRRPSLWAGGRRKTTGDGMYKLSDEDGRAVDMLLNVEGPGRVGRAKDGNGHGNGGDAPAHYAPAPGKGNGGDGNGHSHAGGAFGAAPSSFSERLVRVGQLLDVLEQMPAPEPSSDLTARTMALIDRAPATARPAAPLATDRPGTAPRPQA
jgi:hypothetical protein